MALMSSWHYSDFISLSFPLSLLIGMTHLLSEAKLLMYEVQTNDVDQFTESPK